MWGAVRPVHTSLEGDGEVLRCPGVLIVGVESAVEGLEPVDLLLFVVLSSLRSNSVLKDGVAMFEEVVAPVAVVSLWLEKGLGHLGLVRPRLELLPQPHPARSINLASVSWSIRGREKWTRFGSVRFGVLQGPLFDTGVGPTAASKPNGSGPDLTPRSNPTKSGLAGHVSGTIPATDSNRPRSLTREAVSYASC